MISTVEKVLFLKNVDLFKNIPGEELSHIAQIADEVEYRNEQTVISEGDEGDAWNEEGDLIQYVRVRCPTMRHRLSARPTPSEPGVRDGSRGLRTPLPLGEGLG